jgi:hypothetical protein
MNRKNILLWLKARYEGMRRDPGINKDYPNIDPKKTFEQLLSENSDPNFAELKFISDYHPKDIMLFPLFMGTTKGKGKLTIAGHSDEYELSEDHLVIVIDFSKINPKKKTININWIKRQLSDLWEYYIKRSTRSKYNYSELDNTYLIGDQIRKLKDNNPKVTWEEIAEHCGELGIYSIGKDMETAKKTLETHYWPRYQDIVFKKGWKRI